MIYGSENIFMNNNDIIIIIPSWKLNAKLRNTQCKITLMNCYPIINADTLFSEKVMDTDADGHVQKE